VGSESDLLQLHMLKLHPWAKDSIQHDPTQMLLRDLLADSRSMKLHEPRPTVLQKNGKQWIGYL